MKSLGEESGLEREFLFKKNHNNLVLFYSWNKDPYEVIALSEEYFRKFNQEDALLSKLYRLSGVAYRSIGNFEKSIQYLKKSIYVSEKIENTREYSKSILNLIRTYVFYEDPNYLLQTHLK